MDSEVSNGSAISIVTVVMNRTNHLLATASKVSQWPCHAEHLIVDWSSECPLERATLPDDSRIRLLRVEGERRWQLTRAYNFAIGMASHEIVLKLDADCWINRTKTVEIDLDPGTYLRSAQGGGLNGIFMIRRDDFFAVGGFNEYLLGYGHDDKDLYHRLDRTCQSSFFQPDIFRTIEHGDSERVSLRKEVTDSAPKGILPWVSLESIALMEESKVRNRMLAEKMMWTKGDGRSRYLNVGINRWKAEEASIPVPPHPISENIRMLGNRVYLENILGLPERFLEMQIPNQDLEVIRTWHRFLSVQARLRILLILPLLRWGIRAGRMMKRFGLRRRAGA